MAKILLHFRAVFEGTYEADPENYETDDVSEMIKIDLENLADDPESFLEVSDDCVSDVKIWQEKDPCKP